MRWKDKFQKHILERGYNYTYNVNNVKISGNHVEACEDRKLSNRFRLEFSKEIILKSLNELIKTEDRHLC